MFYMDMNGVKYSFEKFQYIKSYNDYSKVVIDNLYAYSKGDIPAGPAKSNKVIKPSEKGLVKGFEVEIKLYFMMAALSMEIKHTSTTEEKKVIKHNGKPSSVSGEITKKVTKEEKEIFSGVDDGVPLMEFKGVIQSISLFHNSDHHETTYRITITSEFANMSGTVNQAFAFPPNEGDEQRNISSVVNGPMEKLAPGSTKKTDIASKDKFPLANTSSAIIAATDAKNLAYGISKDYAFSIYDTQRKDNDKNNGAVVEIKRIGKKGGIKVAEYTLGPAGGGSAGLVLDKVRQIARNNVVYDGSISLNPIQYYKNRTANILTKDKPEAEDVKLCGKAMYPLETGPNPIDLSGKDKIALLTPSDPFEFNEDGKDAEMKVKGRKDYKIFERSEYEMKFLSAPSITAKVLGDSERKKIQGEIDDLEKQKKKEPGGDPEHLEKVGIQNIGCSACPAKVRGCSLFAPKRWWDYYETIEDQTDATKKKSGWGGMGGSIHARNAWESSGMNDGSTKRLYLLTVRPRDLGPCRPYTEDTLDSLPDNSSVKESAYAVNDILTASYDYLNKNGVFQALFGKDMPRKPGKKRSMTNRPLPGNIPLEGINFLDNVFRFGALGHSGWKCSEHCYHGPCVDPRKYGCTKQEVDRYDWKSLAKNKGVGEFLMEDSKWSPFGENPSAAFCNNMTGESLSCGIQSACNNFSTDKNGYGVYNIYKQSGPFEADLYAYLAYMPATCSMAFYYQFDDEERPVLFVSAAYKGTTATLLKTPRMRNFKHTGRAHYYRAMDPAKAFKECFSTWLYDKAMGVDGPGNCYVMVRPKTLSVINPIKGKMNEWVNLYNALPDAKGYHEAIATWLRDWSFEIGPERSGDHPGNQQEKKSANVREKFKFDDPANEKKYGKSRWNCFPLKKLDRLITASDGAPDRGTKSYEPLVGWTGTLNGKNWFEGDFYFRNNRFNTRNKDVKFPPGRHIVEKAVLKKGINGDNPFDGYVNDHYDGPGGWTRYSRKYMEDDQHNLVLFFHEKISPLAFDCIVGEELRKENPVPPQPDFEKIDEDIDKLKQKLGGVEVDVDVKIETFLDRFPLDYITFKNCSDVSTVVPVEDNKYILKKIETVITNSGKEAEDRKEAFLKAFGGDKEVVLGKDGVYRIKGDKTGKSFYSDFSGVNATLTVAPASTEAGGQFIEGGAKMGIGEYEDVT